MKERDYILNEEMFIDPLLCRKVYSRYLQGHSVEDIEHWVVMYSPWKVHLSIKLINAIIDMMNITRL